jgi:hypothetical protein
MVAPTRTYQCGLLAAALALMTSIAVPCRADSIDPTSLPAQRDRLKHDVDTFVSNTIVTHDDAAFEHWNSEVCPLVAGLNEEQGEFILARLSQAIKIAGAPLGAEKCNPNFFVVFSKDPVPGLTRLLNHHDAKAFDSETEAQLKQFVETTRPVRVWYNVGKTRVEGVTIVSAILDPSSGAARHFSAPQGLDPVYNRVSPQFSSRVNESPVARDILSAIVVIDFTQVRTLNFGQISDYVGMIGLAHIDPDKDFASAPTILNVFKDSDESRPTEMTVWDKALLHALYHAPQRNKMQLSEMQTAAFEDITAKMQN